MGAEMEWVEILQAGGVLAFAGLVYHQLDRFHLELGKLREDMNGYNDRVLRLLEKALDDATDPNRSGAWPKHPRD